MFFSRGEGEADEEGVRDTGVCARECESLIGIRTQENKTEAAATKPTPVQGFRFKMLNPFVYRTAIFTSLTPIP